MTDQRRALLTEREQEILTGEADITDNYRYSVESRIRSRLRDRLPEDVEILMAHLPEVFDEVVYPTVCQPGPAADEEPAATTPTPEHTREAAAGASDAAPTPDEKPHSVPSDAETSDAVAAAVDAVAEGWADSGDRLEARKAAARAVLEYALKDGAVGKSEQGRELHDEYPVTGQNFDTWWRKNVRPVLNEYGEYSQGAHGYVVEEVGR